MALGWAALCSRSTDCEFETWLTVLKMQGIGRMAAQAKSFTQDASSCNRKIHLTYGTAKELLPLP